MPKSNWMTEEERDFLQVTVLELCNSDNGMTSIELWESDKLTPITSKYKRWTLMDAVASLKGMKMLMDLKKTKGNIYFTTPEGQRLMRRLKKGNNGTKPI